MDADALASLRADRDRIQQSGLDVAKVMQAWPQLPRVLFLTMHDNESYRTAAQALGALGLVDKANFVTELLPIISNLAAQSSGVSP